MNDDLLYFWITGTIFGLVMLLVKSPPVWKYFHSIIFLGYFVNAYWEMNGPNHSGYMDLFIILFTIVHIILFLIGKLIFGFFRRQNERSESLAQMFQRQSEENKEGE
ncbi:MAG: hypothetical protein RLZZ30_1814 [Bacteroidota bacterium]|jgi:hypothetical protein